MRRLFENARRKGLVAAALLALLVAPARAAQEDARSELLELLELHGSELPEVRQAAAMRLLALPSRRLDEVMDVLAYRTAPPTGVLPTASEGVLMRLLASWPAEQVTAAVVREVQPGDLADVVRALELFAGAGRAPSIGAMIGLVDGLDPVARQHRLVREAFDAALAGVLERDEDGVAKLATEVRRVDRTWLPEIVSALARRGGERAFRLLEGLAGLDVELDRRILEGLRGWSRWELSGPDCARLLENNLDAPEPELRRAAALALGEVGDVHSFPALVRAVEDEDPRTAHAARWALQRLTGTSAGSDARHWTEWLEQEEAWRDTRGEELLDGLTDADPTTALRWLHELGAHAWFADAIVPVVAPLTRHEDEAVAGAACEVLLRCGSPEAFERLVEALTAERRTVRDSAWRALCALTGARLSPEVGGWLALQG